MCNLRFFNLWKRIIYLGCKRYEQQNAEKSRIHSRTAIPFEFIPVRKFLCWARPLLLLNPFAPSPAMTPAHIGRPGLRFSVAVVNAPQLAWITRGVQQLNTKNWLVQAPQSCKHLNRERPVGWCINCLSTLSTQILSRNSQGQRKSSCQSRDQR